MEPLLFLLVIPVAALAFAFTSIYYFYRVKNSHKVAIGVGLVIYIIIVFVSWCIINPTAPTDVSNKETDKYVLVLHQETTDELESLTTSGS